MPHPPGRGWVGHNGRLPATKANACCASTHRSRHRTTECWFGRWVPPARKPPPARWAPPASARRGLAADRANSAFSVAVPFLPPFSVCPPGRRAVVVSPSAPPTPWVGHNGRLPIESLRLAPRVPPPIVQALCTVDSKPIASGLPGGHLRPCTVGRSAQYTGHRRYLPVASRYRLAALLVVCFVGRLLQCHGNPLLVVCPCTPLVALCIPRTFAKGNPLCTFLGHMAKF